MMIEVLRIVSGSWPVAIVMIAAMAGGIAVYVIRWFKQADQEDKAYRASQAVVVRRDN